VSLDNRNAADHNRFTGDRLDVGGLNCEAA